MERSKVSLKWLEAFQAVGRSGSMRNGAAQLGLSVSTVSHHISCLETELGVILIEHDKRPMQLTPRGAILLARVDEALSVLRKGMAGVSSDDPKAIMRLVRIALIEDFDTGVSPMLISHLARALPSCEFSHLSRPSHQIFELLRSEQIDIGVAASTEFDTKGLVEEPMLRDPFLVVVSSGETVSAEDLLSGRSGLPLLRYSRDQVIGRRIDLHLRRLGVFLPGSVESESTDTILSLVAAGRGWTVTTALNLARSRALDRTLRPVPFPGKAFSRTVSMFRRDTLPEDVFGSVEGLLRTSIQTAVIAPLLESAPWLEDSFHTLPWPSIP